MLAGAREAEKKLGLPEGFIFEITNGDDWSFVLKLHGVIDAGLGRAIRDHCFAQRYGPFPRDEAALDKICLALNFEGRISKISLAKAFQLSDDDGYKFCLALNLVRNTYAHRVENHSKSLRELTRRDGKEDKVLQELIRVPLAQFPEATDGQLRFLTALSAMSLLWQLEFRSQPPPSLLSSLLITRE